MAASGAPLPLAADFAIVSPHAADSARLAAAMNRVSTLLAPARTAAAAGAAPPTSLLRTLELRVADGATEHLGLATKYDYKLTVDPDPSDGASSRAVATASSIYGAMYAMETFAQLVDWRTGTLRHARLAISDAPDYVWRGLMVDAGRRFVNMPTLKNLIDTMAAVKLNVLHLHASDMCRFGVESKLYPNLTSSLTGLHGGFYTQADIKDLISYAGDRGMRVVPEFDIPGHSRGWIPVESEGGLSFCTDAASRSQLDGTDATYKVLHAVLGEMAALFTDEVFNIGSDETAAKGVCTVQTSLDIEKRVLEAVETEFGKTAEGWEEVLFDAGAATNKTIVNAWARHSAAEITATGRRAVESKESAFYFTGAAPGGPKGWARCWYDIGTNVPAAQRQLLLGGEMSMWTDTYCYSSQCGASGGGTPVGAALFDPAQDDAFGKSIGGMIWPRGYVGAAAFWNFNSTADPSAPGFVTSIWDTNDALAARGSLVCPTNCSCDQLSACGAPYIAPTPAPVPTAGAALSLSQCALGAGADGGVANEQRMTLGADGTIRLTADPSLCVHFAGPNAYPLKLAKCPPALLGAGAGDDAFVWQHLVTGEIVHKASGECLDVKSEASVGTWSCASSQDQPNQHWAVDAYLKTIVSLSTYAYEAASTVTAAVGEPTTDVAGFCLTASS
jgi:hexosaminidase